MTLHVTVSEDLKRFMIYGGDPKGGDHINSLISSWPGWSRMPGRCETSIYSGPVSPVSAQWLGRATSEIKLDEKAKNAANHLLARLGGARKALENKDQIQASNNGYRKPFLHQSQAVKALTLLWGRAILADDMGLGKTSTALWTAQALQTDRILVLCPASVKYNWEQEIAKTLGWTTAVIGGTVENREAQFGELRTLYLRKNHLAIVLNYDLLRYLTADQRQLLRQFALDRLVILDECHYLKSSTAQRTQIVRELFCPHEGGAQWRLGLSGTPIRNTIDDIYSQVELVAPGTFGPLHWFLNRYTVQSILEIPFRRGNRRMVKKVSKVRKAKNEAELNLILGTLQIRRLKKDVTNLPPKIITYPELELDEYTEKIYQEMRDYARLLLDKHDDSMSILSPTCKSAVEATARCEQIAQGCVGGVPEDLLPRVSSLLGKHAVAVDRQGWLVFPKAAKLVWLREQLETLRRQGCQAVVFCRFVAPLLWLESQASVAGEGLAVTGDTPLARRQEIFDAFQAGTVRELYISVRIAEGFNLHSCQDELFCGRDWAWAVNNQAMDRCHRIGQLGTVNVQMPIIRHTIEVRQHAALLQKEKDADSALCFNTIEDLKEALG